VAEAFFSDEENLAELVTHMPEEDQHRFNKYGHFRIEAVFIDRLLIVYKPTGLTADNKHRDPEVVTTLKFIDFGVEPRNGAYATVKDEKFGQELNLTHVPRRVFNYPIYMSVPARMQLRWDARTVNGRVWRSLSFAILIKTKNRSDFYSKGNVYCETPNRLKQLYPNIIPTAFKY
jgi:hypothetical protein